VVESAAIAAPDPRASGRTSNRAVSFMNAFSNLLPGNAAGGRKVHGSQLGEHQDLWGRGT
jgi:hypothetical protein